MPPRKKKTPADTPAEPDLSHIAEDLRPLALPIEQLRPDERNARVHDEANLAAIRASLSRFGQRKPVVVNRATGVVEAGNGLVEAAVSLGWTHLAAVRVEDDLDSQTGFALADNRTAELAAWDEVRLLELAAELREADEFLYDELALSVFAAGGADTVEEEPAEELPEIYELVVTFATDSDRQAFFHHLAGQGYQVRVG